MSEGKAYYRVYIEAIRIRQKSPDNATQPALISTVAIWLKVNGEARAQRLAWAQRDCQLTPQPAVEIFPYDKVSVETTPRLSQETDSVVLATTTYEYLHGLALTRENANGSLVVEVNQDHELGAVTVSVRVDVGESPLPLAEFANETCTKHGRASNVSPERRYHLHRSVLGGIPQLKSQEYGGEEEDLATMYDDLDVLIEGKIEGSAPTDGGRIQYSVVGTPRSRPKPK